jgi:hypothetical protein|tara:strand:+ start:446 stop:802 length:357 start_codon:yes stop_codon:yes gene_type:complete
MTKSTSTFTTAQIEALETFAAATESGMITNDDVKQLIKSDDFEGKTASMVRGKVVAMKLYKTVETSARPASASVLRKSDFVSSIEELLSLNEGSLPSFEKASKKDLQLLVDTMVALNG